MTKSEKKMFYSYDFGGIHILSFNTEEQYDSFAPGSEQYKFIEEDLIKANENRKNVPWVIPEIN